MADNKYYDYKGSRLKEGSVISFNQHAYMYKHSYVYGLIKSISNKGKITFYIIPKILTSEENDTTYCERTFKLNWDKELDDIIEGELLPKRGNKGGKGIFRYKGNDVTVYKVKDPKKEFTEENCY